MSLVKLRAPLSSCGGYLGGWGTAHAPEWGRVSPADKERLGVSRLGVGEFWLDIMLFHIIVIYVISCYHVILVRYHVMLLSFILILRFLKSF